MRFCPMCATPLEARLAYGRERPVCPGCGYVAFHDPKVAVGVIVEREGHILLTLRAHDPGRGQWALPAGYMEWDEEPRHTAAREVGEETGLRVRVDRLIGVYAGATQGVVLIVYTAAIAGGELCASEECHEVRFFPPDRLPALAFPSMTAILADWRANETPL